MPWYFWFALGAMAMLLTSALFGLAWARTLNKQERRDENGL